MESTYWSPGTQIQWRSGGWVEPMTVVRDDKSGLVAWLAAGTPTRAQVRADGRGLRADKATMFTAPRISVETTWQDHDVLRVAPPGRWWSVWVFFEPGTHVFEGWYVNIEDVHRRDGDTLNTRDLVLDVWVEPDRTHARKDEDELVMAVEQGRFNRAEAELITSIADEIEGVLDAWGPPFSDGWETFEPDPGWPVPQLSP